MIYLDECETMHQIGLQSNPFGLAFHKNICNQILNEWRVKEILIDSTYKTNKQKSELFTVIASCMGAGFPLCYFLLDAGTEGLLKTREESLTFFLKSIKEKFPNLRPSFVFTDKDTSQIKAIRNVFGVDASLCFWHMKRAIKTKLKELRKDRKSSFKEQEESKLMELIDGHYFRSTVAIEAKNLELKKIGT